MSQAASALSDAFRVAVYDTHDKAYPPETRPPSKRDGDDLLDKHAVLAADCWVYPVVSVFPDEQHAHVPFEFKVDPSGVVLRPIGKPNLDKPIEKRPAAFEYDPDHPHGVAFAHKVDSQGRPLMVRLFASPFRLTKTAISELCSSKYIKGRKKHLPYLDVEQGQDLGPEERRRLLHPGVANVSHRRGGWRDPPTRVDGVQPLPQRQASQRHLRPSVDTIREEVRA